MKRRLLLAIPLIVFVVFGVFLYQGLGMNPFDRESALKTKKFPEFTLPALEDPERQLSNADLEGEVTLVNVWGEWCPTCKQEMPQLLALANQGVRLVGVDYKDTRTKGLQFLDEFGNPFEFNVFDADGSLGFDLGVYGAPETFLIDAQGVIRYHHTGYIKPEDVRDTILPEVEKWRQ
ncbi:DsbE family thiol:disulfide interchange protein [Halomonas halocynthiae]|uniref:DsbE family thiol:disulfide interchange protein n=1 Tax=Halomonas halocynthiae TaxID=176290 RepID=UPI0003FA0F04|nr:DsbE family thiol:disulfide interchange protein [Halomonas halocynthiae]